MLRTIGQIIGWIAVAEGFTIFLGKTREKILIAKLISDVLWMLNYGFIGAVNGAVLNGISVCREAVFYQRGRKKWASHIIWLFVFMAAIAISCAFTWQGTISLIPTAGSLISVISLYVKRPQIMRATSIGANVLWLIYNGYLANYSAFVASILILLSAIIGIIREITQNKKAEQVPSK